MMTFQKWINKKTHSEIFTKMNFLILPAVFLLLTFCSVNAFCASEGEPGVAVLLVDTDRVMGQVDEDICQTL